MTAGAPLSGLKVLDLSRLLPGPYLTLLMQDMGATVVKVEEPGSGDYMRWSPPHVGGVSQIFAVLNRGKKSIGLDLRNESDRNLFHGLVPSVDIVVESFRPGVMDRMGCSAEALHALNPSLVILSITGYAPDTTLATRAGHDLNFMARSGLLSMNRDRDGRPVVPGFQASDIAGGTLFPLVQLLGALIARDRTGNGTHIQASMADHVTALGVLPLAEILGAGPDFDPADAVLAGRWACYGIYETSDERFMALGALEPKFWKGFCECVERPDWIRRHLSRGDENTRLREDVAALFKTRSQSEWVQVFNNADVCCEPVLSPIEALEGGGTGESWLREEPSTGLRHMKTSLSGDSWKSAELKVPSVDEDREEVLSWIPSASPLD